MFRKLAGFAAAAGLVVTVACGQSDAGITTSVKSQLAGDDVVKAYQVDVDTQNRVVTLTGHVDTPAAKETAVQIARNTDGVRDVIDQIMVGETAATSGIAGEADIEVDTPDVDAPDVDVDADGDDIEGDLRRGAEATADAAKKAGQATVEGARKVGGAVRDAVTDDDRDSDNDGK